jgi:hypothetical protein
LQEARLWAQLTPNWVVGSLYARLYGTGVSGSFVGGASCDSGFTGNFYVAQDAPFRFIARQTAQFTTTAQLTAPGGGDDNTFAEIETGTCHLPQYWLGYLSGPPGDNSSISLDTNGTFLAGLPYNFASELSFERGWTLISDGYLEWVRTLDFAIILNSTNPTNPPNIFLQSSPTNLSLQWPALITNVVLEATTDLTQPNLWASVTNQATVVGGALQVTTTYDYPARFFRLRQVP